MDPNQALTDLINLITTDGTPDDIDTQCTAITDWLRGGGFRPTTPLDTHINSALELIR